MPYSFIRMSITFESLIESKDLLSEGTMLDTLTEVAGSLGGIIAGITSGNGSEKQRMERLEVGNFQNF